MYFEKGKCLKLVHISGFFTFLDFLDSEYAYIFIDFHEKVQQ